LLIGVVILFGFLLNHFVFNPPRSENQQQAISKAVVAAKGFDEKSRGYSFALLNTAVQYADEKKCADARTVYEQVQEHPNGMTKIDMKAYKSRIDSSCTGK
jgi:hypothetical protein